MKFLRSRRGLAALAVVVLILFLFRPGVHRLRQRISGSIGSALGRRVSLDNVRIHVLPRPGFDLEGLVIYDDPSFSAEPMVRAQEVSAAIRIRSLFRLRLEIATLTATDPSINLVRNGEGRWNLASLIERNSHIPAAPTGKPSSEPRPAFPYLEATNARINFKIGQAKKSWALTDADVALWQDSENSWGARLKAQPVRTDFNLTDTGVIQVDASWQRASNLSDTPLQVAMQWQKGQLGQITKLFSGRDHGWRGGVDVAAILSGTPRALLVRSQVGIDEFHRYDIMTTGVRLSTNCDMHYSTEDGTLRDLACASALPGGSLGLRGNIGPIKAEPDYDLTLSAEKVPLTSFLQILRQSKKGLPADLAASGQLDAEFHAMRTAAGAPQWTGQGTAADVQLTSNTGKNQITLGDIPFTARDANAKGGRAAKLKIESEPSEPHLLVGPILVGMGGTAPATASGWVSASGYRLALRGDAAVTKLYRLADAFGLTGFHPVAEGAARIDLSLAGVWQGFAAPQVVGAAHLSNVHTGMRGLNPEIDIVSAGLKLDPETVTIDEIIAQTGDTHWNGKVKVPRHCLVEGCVVQFDVGADQLSSGGFVDWFTPRPSKRPWYSILSSGGTQGKSPLLSVRAKGRLRVARLNLKKVVVSQVVTQVDVNAGKVTLTGLRGQIFQGTHQGDWLIEVSSLPPHYQGRGQFQDVSMTQVSAAMNDGWATGIVDGKFSITASGDTFPDLLAHGEGQLQFSLRDGMLPRIAIPEASKPLSVHALTGDLKLKDGAWTLSAGRLESHDGVYRVSGAATQGKGMNILLTRGDEEAWTVTGTLSKPSVAHATRTEARTRTVVKP